MSRQQSKHRLSLKRPPNPMNTPEKPKIMPKAVSALDVAFPTSIDGFLPPYAEIPAEFKRHSGTDWNRIMAQWFYSGLPKGTKFVPREAIDELAALKHLQYCLGSWEPKHEHKEAGVAYLMSLWFERVEMPQAQPHPTP